MDLQRVGTKTGRQNIIFRDLTVDGNVQFPNCIDIKRDFIGFAGGDAAFPCIFGTADQCDIGGYDGGCFRINKLNRKI